MYASAGGVAGGLSCALQVLQWRMRCAAMPHAVHRAGGGEVLRENWKGFCLWSGFSRKPLILPVPTQAQI